MLHSFVNRAACADVASSIGKSSLCISVIYLLMSDFSVKSSSALLDLVYHVHSMAYLPEDVPLLAESCLSLLEVVLLSKSRASKKDKDEIDRLCIAFDRVFSLLLASESTGVAPIAVVRCFYKRRCLLFNLYKAKVRCLWAMSSCIQLQAAAEGSDENAGSTLFTLIASSFTGLSAI